MIYYILYYTVNTFTVEAYELTRTSSLFNLILLMKLILTLTFTPSLTLGSILATDLMTFSKTGTKHDQ